MMINSLKIRTWSRLGMEKSFFGIGLAEVLSNRSDVYAVTADLCGYSGMDRVARNHPEQIVNVGIQEQNMLGVACGLALEGNTVYAGSYGAFAVARAMEQVRHNMAVMNQDIKLVGYSSGFSKGPLGRSHWATEDLSFTRCLPNLTVISPADALEAIKVCIAVADHKGPCYIRLTYGSDCVPVYQEDYSFQIGRGIVLRPGSDTMILATGRIVPEALKAAELLEQEGISAGVANIHTIKPLDEALLQELVPQYDTIYTAEEHNVIGGLGSAVAEWMSSRPQKAVLHRIGMQDCIYKIGSEKYIWRQAGLCHDQIAERIRKDLRKDGERI